MFIQHWGLPFPPPGPRPMCFLSRKGPGKRSAASRTFPTIPTLVQITSFQVQTPRTASQKHSFTRSQTQDRVPSFHPHRLPAHPRCRVSMITPCGEGGEGYIRGRTAEDSISHRK